MADDNQLERSVNIQSTVHVGTATDKTTVSGAKVSIGLAREVHVHGDTTPPSSFRSVAIVGVLAFLGAVLINIATSQLPGSLQPYLWLAWPLAVLVTGISICVAYRQSGRVGSNIALGGNLEQRNRRAMLAKVKTVWIDGLLEQSLAKEPRIALDLTTQPDAVHLPLNALVQELNQQARPLPAGTPIIDVFGQMGGALLILGAPGAGKTTLLLELARDLIARAEQDEGHPIPVVFNLSSWAEKRCPLKAWLVEELNTKYDVPRKLAQAWMHTDMVLPLLDGLDEVAAEHRGDCVEIINIYRQEHGLMPLTVCSRVADYEVLTTKLRLRGAIAVQPLTHQQVDDYLERAGEKLEGVRAAQRHNAELSELLDTPLMLSIVALAYKDKPLAELQSRGTLDEWRLHLFDAYIKTMFKRRSEETRYTQEQTRQRLGRLAQGMIRQSQSVFHIEGLQPEWLPSRRAQLQYNLLDRLAGALVGAVAGALFGGLLDGLRYALAGGLTGGFIALSFGGNSDIETLQQRRTGRTIVDALAGALFGGLLGGLVIVLVAGWHSVLIGMVSGAIPGIIFGLLTGKPNAALRHVIVIERLRWLSTKAWRSALGGLLAGLLVGLVNSLLVYVLVGEVLGGLNGGLASGLFIGLLGGLIGGLVGGLHGDLLSTTMRPNQGIRRSASSALVGGLGGGLVGVLILGSVTEWVAGLAFGLVFGLIGALAFGGYACLSHLALRLILARNGYLPLRLVPFLDYCAERIFLRKVGGGYIFVHRLLMEHFASLYTEDKPAASPSNEAAD